MDQHKSGLPEGQQPEEGTEDEFNFMTDIFKSLNDQASPILKTVLENIKDNEVSQKRFILNMLSEELKVEYWQDVTKTGENNQAKLEGWNKLRTEIIRELFYFIYTSQVFLSCSYIAFSTTGKQLFEIHSGAGGLDSLKDYADKLEQNMQDKNEEQKTPEDDLEKKKMTRREKIVNIVHNHFMHLLFDVLTDLSKYLKYSIIDVVVDETLKDISLKSKFTPDGFKDQVLNTIFTQINDVLLSPTQINQNKEYEDSDTDFDSDNDTECTNKTLSLEKIEALKQNSVKTYKSHIISKLLE